MGRDTLREKQLLFVYASEFEFPLHLSYGSFFSTLHTEK